MSNKRLSFSPKKKKKKKKKSMKQLRSLKNFFKNNSFTKMIVSENETKQLHDQEDQIKRLEKDDYESLKIKKEPKPELFAKNERGGKKIDVLQDIESTPIDRIPKTTMPPIMDKIPRAEGKVVGEKLPPSRKEVEHLPKNEKVGKSFDDNPNKLPKKEPPKEETKIL